MYSIYFIKYINEIYIKNIVYNFFIIFANENNAFVRIDSVT